MVATFHQDSSKTERLDYTGQTHMDCFTPLLNIYIIYMQTPAQKCIYPLPEENERKLELEVFYT